MSVAGMFRSFDSIIVGAEHIATVVSKATQLEESPVGQSARVIQLVEKILANEDARDLVAMHLIHVRATEMFVSRSCESYELSMQKARNEIALLLDPGFMGKLLRNLVAHRITFERLFDEIKNCNEPSLILLKLLQATSLVQNTAAWLERTDAFEKAAA